MITVFDSKRFSGPAYLGTTAAALYTTATGKTALVQGILLHNSGAAAATYTLHLVPSGDAAGAGNRIFHASLDADETVLISLGGSGLVLAEGDSIQGLASATDSIVATIHGAEVS